MGVYIKGMEMPGRCGHCPCFNAENPIHCQAVKADKAKRIAAPYGLPRPDWCPLVEVPPHGDLIDRRELMKTLEIAEECENCESHVGIHCAKESFVDACEAICDAPTIIGEEGAP